VREERRKESAMALQFHYPATDSSTLVTPVVNPAALTFATDWTKGASENGTASSQVIENVTCPLDTGESALFARKPMANVYANTTVDKALWAPTTKGWKLTVSLKSTPYVTDTDDATFKQALPIWTQLQITFPANSAITDDVLKNEIGRMLGLLYETGDTTMNNRIKSLMRGGLTPKDL
jgi:hypothetical protein